jgi:hypothetical protein
MGTSVFDDPMFTVYDLPEKPGFTSPPWPGFPAFIAAPYGGVIPNLATNEAHLIGGLAADGNVKLEAAVTQAPLLWQRQVTPAVVISMLLKSAVPPVPFATLPPPQWVVVLHRPLP